MNIDLKTKLHKKLITYQKAVLFEHQIDTEYIFEHFSPSFDTAAKLVKNGKQFHRHFI